MVKNALLILCIFFSYIFISLKHIDDGFYINIINKTKLDISFIEVELCDKKHSFTNLNKMEKIEIKIKKGCAKAFVSINALLDGVKKYNKTKVSNDYLYYDFELEIKTNQLILNEISKGKF